MTADSRYIRNEIISWERLQRDVRELSSRLLKEHPPFKGLIAVTRGGLVPAAIVARELGIHHIDTLCMVSYDWKLQSDSGCTVLKGVEGDGEGKLVIDDLVDTGTTAQEVRRLLPRAHIACIYAKPAGVPHVDTYIREVAQDTWVLFPWDSAPQFIEPLAVGRAPKE